MAFGRRLTKVIADRCLRAHGRSRSARIWANEPASFRPSCCFRRCAAVRDAQPKVVAVEAREVLDMEYTAVKMFAQLAKRQSQRGVQLWLIGMTPRGLAIIQRSPLGQLLGREGMYFNLEIAVARYLDDAAVRDQS